MRTRPRSSRPLLAAILTTLVTYSMFTCVASAQQPAPLRGPAARDVRGWMPDVAARLEHLASDRRAAAGAPLSAASTHRDEPPWWWLPCPPPDEARP